VSRRRRPPVISVIVPHLNQPEGLRRCLASLAEQSFDLDRVEIIVVDNGSTVLPVGICEAFSHVRLAEEAAPGPGPARNKGISISQAPLLAFIDADCIADRNWLAAIHAVFADDAVQIVGGDVRIALGDPNQPTMIEAYESIFAYRQKEYIERKGFSGTGNLAIRRSIYDAVGPFAGIEVAEDYEWGRRATRLGHSLRYLPDMIVFHPARASFADLCVKWDRHISHDFTGRVHGSLGEATWVARALLIACSPIFELWRIMSSERISSWRERWLAAIAVSRIRAYRSRRMLEMAFGRGQTRSSRSWNRI
jgi:glycosyltransferase involved in cell wall biosynthesis